MVTGAAYVPTTELTLWFHLFFPEPSAAGGSSGPMTTMVLHAHLPSATVMPTPQPQQWGSCSHLLPAFAQSQPSWWDYHAAFIFWGDSNHTSC